MTKQEFRQAVLANAIADIGKGEEGENNWGPYVAGLLKGVGIDYPASWCAAAVVRWIELATGYNHEIDGNNRHFYRFAMLETPSAKAMFNAARELGWKLNWVLDDGKWGERPQPGDLIFFERSGESWFAHVGVVEQFGWDDAGILCNTIEGNKGPFPAKVQRCHYEMRIPNLLGFVRLLGVDQEAT
jgi:hypothetical protein